MGDTTVPRMGSIRSTWSQPQRTTGHGQGPPHKPTQRSLGFGVPGRNPFPHPHAGTSGPRSPPLTRPLQKTPFIPFSAF